MKTKRTTKALIITSAILLIGGTIAFAHDGWGYGGYGGHHMRGYRGHMMGPGYGGPMMGYGPGWGKRGAGYGNLSDEEAAKLDAAREKFYNETKELRREINNKQVDLRDEMVKDEADTGKVLKLQRELSKLQADFDQKAVQHRLEMRKLFPEGFQGRGFGPGHGSGPGRGFGRGGYCWE
jgi:Spy/CpxP family protein refolding chaperone